MNYLTKLVRNHSMRGFMSVAIVIILAGMQFNTILSYAKDYDVIDDPEPVTDIMYAGTTIDYDDEVQLNRQVEEIVERILSERQAQADEEERIRQEQESQRRNSINLTDITKKSNLTADEFDYIIDRMMIKAKIKHSRLVGMGSTIKEVEDKYNINGLFLLGVSSLESYYGTSNKCNNENNFFGIKKDYFSSKYSCMDYFGKLIRTHYINEGRKTITTIQPKYCPNSNTWAPNVSTLMNKYADIYRSELM